MRRLLSGLLLASLLVVLHGPHLQPVRATPCPDDPAPGIATCMSLIHPLSDRAAQAAAWHPGTTKSGSYTPADLASLYRISPAASSRATIGVVVSGSDPNTAAQLAFYRSFFGLPPCTEASGCFREVGQDGSSRLPATDSHWVAETALDVQAVSAICATCRILLVSANSARASDLGAAAHTAARLGATYLSLSYGSPPSLDDSRINLADYNVPGVTYVAATGDHGYGTPPFPASASNVIAVGGTSAKLVSGTWRQTAWPGSGSGCATSLLGGVTGALLDLLSGKVCSRGRPVSDISALGDDQTGMMFYQGGTWWNGGGTSLATPIIASLFALAGNHMDPQVIYDNAAADPASFVDITSGSNGSCGNVLCNAGAGWDGPTGIGTPAGLAGLSASGTVAAPLAQLSSASSLAGHGRRAVRLRYRLFDAGTGSPIAQARVMVQARHGRGRYTTVRSALTDEGGALTYRARPKRRTTYRVVFAGDVVHLPSTTRAITVSPPRRRP